MMHDIPESGMAQITEAVSSVITFEDCKMIRTITIKIIGKNIIETRYWNSVNTAAKRLLPKIDCGERLIVDSVNQLNKKNRMSFTDGGLNALI